MKKSICITALIAAAAVMAGCGGNKTEQTTAQTTAPAEAQTTTAAVTQETGTAAPAAATEAQTEDNSGKKAILTDTQGNVFYREDCTLGEWGQLTVPYTYMAVSGGMYHDSDTEPGLFVPDEFEYGGERASAGDLARLEAGTVIGGVTVKSAETGISSPWNDELGDADPNADEGFTLQHVSVDLDGEIKLTGVVRYYFDEMYAVSSGDIMFIPDNSYAGLPIPVDITGSDNNYGTVNFDEKGGFDPDEGYTDTTYGGGICVYSEAPLLHVGNLKDHYSDRSDLYDFFGGGNENFSARAEITLTDVHLAWNDNFGSAYACTGVIKEIKAI
ncbi:MAG: hypothetical protein J6O50_12365 [Ruminiclostridium sp.]|nr:hypothetical protein [Ruminiclostridium sp.]